MSRLTAARVCAWLIVLTGIWAVILDITGGVSWRLGVFRISSRDPMRPAAMALACAVAVWYLAPAAVSHALDRLRVLINRWAVIMALALGIITSAIGVHFGTFVASGADSYGYVSQADLWLTGHLRIDQGWFPAQSIGIPDLALAPLGYRPGTVPHTIVPVYSPGLPLLMAIFKAVAGAQAPFYVVPLLGGLVVVGTFLLGRLLFDQIVGLAASTLLAASPAFLFHLMFPMSDVPVAAAWLLALILAIRRQPFRAGLACGLALLIRPNLLLLTIGAGLIAVRPVFSRRDGLTFLARRFGAFGIGVLPAALGIAVLNRYLYGSPWESGYGALSAIYQWEYLRPNLTRYGTWLMQTQTPFVLAAILPLVSGRFIRLAEARHLWHVRTGLAMFLLLLAVSYLFYTPFDEWWYLRFFLSGFPVLLVLAVGAARSTVWHDHASNRRTWRTAHAFAFGILMIGVCRWELIYAAGRRVTQLRVSEQRYAVVGHDLAAMTSSDAVFLAMQHSGSLRYYSSRLTIRYDWIPPESLDQTLDALREHGFHPYIVLDDWEQTVFRQRFSARSTRGRLDWKPLKEWKNGVSVAVYDPWPDPVDVSR